MKPKFILEVQEIDGAIFVTSPDYPGLCVATHKWEVVMNEVKHQIEHLEKDNKMKHKLS